MFTTLQPQDLMLLLFFDMDHVFCLLFPDHALLYPSG